MEFEKLKKITEVLLFSSDRPLSLKQIKDIINEEKAVTGVAADLKQIEKAINELMQKYSSDDFSFGIINVAGAYRFATKREYAPWLSKLNREKLKRRLSQSALETLAIIAYRQPITKSEIEAIRGVNVDYIIGSLLEKELITIRGRAEIPGRPMLYGTTDSFLEYLGLNSLDDLPPLKALEEIIKSGPPEGISQSDIDFFEEINFMRGQSRENTGEDIEEYNEGVIHQLNANNNEDLGRDTETDENNSR